MEVHQTMRQESSPIKHTSACRLDGIACEKVRAEDEKGLPHVWIAGLDHKFGSQTTAGVRKNSVFLFKYTQLKNDTVFLQVFWSLLGTGCRLAIEWL